MRSVALVLVAVVIGVLLLRDAGSSSTPVSASGGTTHDTKVDKPGNGANVTTTSTTAPLDPSKVTVLVANGSGVKGAAGRISEKLKAANYVTAPATNTKTPVNASMVYFRTGYEAAANAVAKLFNPVPKVAALPDPSPVANLGTAQVLVVIAADLARA
jgi:hypothetical protein